MIATILPGPLQGTVRVPASKSAAHRALIAAALADRPTRVAISALNQDIEATIGCLRALGATITREGDFLGINPGPFPASAALDCGESGSTLRFLIPVAATLGVEARFTGRGRLPERPNAVLTAALRAHGAAIDSDLLPMRVSGRISGGRWALPGNISSQYVTGLLFALPLLEEDSALTLTTKLESAAYVDMTLSALRRFGIVVRPAVDGWHIPGGQRYRSPGELSVEGDWSAAAFWFAANAMGSSIQIEGLDSDSPQGDRAVAGLLGKPEINAENVPDLVPALAVAAASRPGRTVITGAARLRLKESDRLESVAQMLRALGAGAQVLPDGLIIQGRERFLGSEHRTSGQGGEAIMIDGANDHRIVMAAAVAATRAAVPVRILDAQAVAKSYPDFFRDFEKLGGRVHVE